MDPTRQDPPKKKATAISAYEFSNNASSSTGRFQFGLSYADIAAGLRRIADEVDTGKILPQRAQVVTEARRDEYTASALILEFVEAIEGRKPNEESHSVTADGADGVGRGDEDHVPVLVLGEPEASSG